MTDQVDFAATSIEHAARPEPVRDRITDLTARPITRPWQPPYTPPGKLDFFRIHAHALDRLGDVLAAFLPEGTEQPGAWYVGYHLDRPTPVRVSLLSGSWAEPETGASGRDLVSLVAHLFGLSQARAAQKLAEWLGIDEVAHA